LKLIKNVPIQLRNNKKLHFVSKQNLSMIFDDSC